MLEKLSKAIITSEYFGANVPLNDLLSRRINILFGTNGSGKSTIADAFRHFSEGDDTALQLPGADFDEEGRRRIFVFDERFVRKNLEMSDNTKGLGTIVTIGEAVDRAKEEKELEGKINNAQSEMDTAELSKETEEKTATQLGKKLDTDLKQDGDYADLGKGIKCQQRKISVDLVSIFNVQNNPALPGYNKAQLRDEINTGIKSLSATREQNKISWFPSLLYVADLQKSSEKAKELLAEEVEKPELNEREQRILQINYQRTKEEIVERGADTCPLCHQAIDSGYRSDLAEMIRHIENALRDVASGYKAELESCRTKCVLGDYPVPEDVSDLFMKETRDFEDAYRKLREEAGELVKKIDYRIQNVQAAPSECDLASLESRYKDFEKAVNQLSSKITAYNQAIDNREALQRDLLEKNVILAYLEHESDIKAYQGALQRSDEAKKQYNDAKAEREDCQQRLQSLQAKRSNTNEAREFINKCLQFIFMQPGRLELVSGDGADNGIYILKSNGRPVTLDKVSVGERNAIALAYFFASTFQGKRTEERYTDEALYIIDDPISSFDQGNRVGMLTFISDVFSNIIRSNVNSKILTLTHDLQTTNNLMTIAQRIVMEPDGFLELRDRQVHLSEKVSGNNYHQLMREIYDFAAADASGINQFNGMGNKIRQLLESYTSFNYNKSLDAILNNDTILDYGVPPQMQNYYRRLAARIAFNTTSHSGLRVDALGDGGDSFTQTELQSVARNILAFISFTNPLHLDFILKGLDHNNKIEEWKKQIPIEDEASMIKKFNEIDNLKKQLNNAVLTVERDGLGNCHCGKCALPYSALRYVGQKVRLSEIADNTNPSTRNDYPVYSTYKVLNTDH